MVRFTSIMLAAVVSISPAVPSSYQGTCGNADEVLYEIVYYDEELDDTVGIVGMCDLEDVITEVQYTADEYGLGDFTVLLPDVEPEDVVFITAAVPVD